LRKKARGDGARAALSPVPRERLSHGAVELLDRPIGDDTGAVSRPYRAIDILGAMERRGAITPAMHVAGDDFNRLFRLAQLDPLRAGQMMRESRGRRELSERVEFARDKVWRAMIAAGGSESPGGSCLWHVIGWEGSLKEWALEQGWNGRRIGTEAASGILISALGTLAQHFGRA
jgi:hypothetical protein